MAKNVSITEDGNNKIIENAAKIRTSLVGGGTCDWIPKDDVPLQKLTVTEDGTYRPEENYYGFSQVTARGIGNVIEGELIEKTITKNGTYNIKDESGNPYGYSKIIVNIETSGDDSGGDSGGGGGGGITGKDEDGNDTMAETDEDGNIVMTALPTEIKVIIPPTKLEYNRYEEIDYSGISVYAYISKAVHWLGVTTTAISEGSTNGTVVIDGKSISVSVGDGVTYSPAPAVTYRLVWDGIKWVKSNGYSAEKALWKSDKYPTGKIPFDELLFPIHRINASNSLEKKKVYKSSPSLSMPVCIKNKYDYNLDFQYPGNILWDFTYNITIYALRNAVIESKASIASFLPLSHENIADIIIASDSENEYVTIDYKNEELFHFLYGNYESGIYDEYETIVNVSDQFNIMRDFVFRDIQRIYTRSFPYSEQGESQSGIETIQNLYTPFSNMRRRYIYTYNGKTVYYTLNSIPRFTYADPSVHQRNVEWPLFFDISNEYTIADNNMANTVAWTMVYGSEDDSALQYAVTLPVQWKRPGDGKILETTFTAWMKDDGSEAS